MELGNSVTYLKIRLISLSYVFVCFCSCLGTSWMRTRLQLPVRLTLLINELINICRSEIPKKFILSSCNSKGLYTTWNIRWFKTHIYSHRYDLDLFCLYKCTLVQQLSKILAFEYCTLSSLMPLLNSEIITKSISERIAAI